MTHFEIIEKIYFRFLVAVTMLLWVAMPLAFGASPVINKAIPIPKPIAKPKPTPSPSPAPTEEESHPGISLEADYSEAVFEYTNGRYREAIKMLDALLKKDRKYIQALELKALMLKIVKDEKASIDLYEQLIPLKPVNERGPYHFELGVLYYRAKKFDKAKPHLTQAAKLKFNTGTAHFFLGTGALQMKEYGEAIRQFKTAIPDVPDEMKVASHFSMAMAHAQRGYGPGATNEFIITRNEAAKLENNPSAKATGLAAERALEPYNRSSWFGSLTLNGQYDGNVSSISNSVAPEQASGKVSMKSNLTFSGGYSSSPTRTWQYMATYRFTGNYDFNQQAIDYQFATNTFTFFLTHEPLAMLNWGTKLEGSYGFQDREDPATSAYSFRPYNYSATFAPFVKHELVERAPLTFEVGFQPQGFAMDGTGTEVRAGTTIRPKLSFQLGTDSNYLTPSGSVTYELNNALGTNQLSRTFLLNVSNSMQFRNNHLVSLSLSYSISSYPLREPEPRTDTNFNVSVSWSHSVNARFSLTADATYTVNNSTLPDTYSYTKPTASVGFAYAL